jgi:hypothetical protein
MTCRSCGAEIADKAIVCYRCGTPTADAASRPPVPSARPRAWIAAPVVLVIVALAVWLIPKTTPGSPERIGAWVLTWIVAFGVVTWIRRSRGR